MRSRARLWRTLVLAALAFGACRREGARPAASAARQLPADAVPRAELVYARPDGLWLRAIGPDGMGAARRLVAEGTYPRFSPDGAWVAFVRGREVMRVPVTGGEPATLAEAKAGRAVAWSPDGGTIYFTDGDAVRAVDLATRVVRPVVTGQNWRELDVDGSGTRMVATVRGLMLYVMAIDPATGKARELASGCSATISPDGGRVVHNRRDHHGVDLRRWDDARIVGAVTAPPGEACDNQFWSNADAWLVSVTEGKARNVCLHRVDDDAYVLLTDEGDCDRPDLFVAPRAGGA